MAEIEVDELAGGLPAAPAPNEMDDISLGENQTAAWAKIKAFGDNVAATHQSIKISEDQVKNSTGAYVYTVSDKIRVRRFLILGTSGGTYYASEKQLTLQNAKAILDMLEQGKGLEVLTELEKIDKANRAPKMTPLIFCLALVARNGTPEMKKKAYELLPKLCRIPTHLFQFVEFCEKANNGKSTGWGRKHRESIGDWYMSKEIMNLAMLVTKYKQREGWAHRDVIRLSHPVVSRSHAFKRRWDGSICKPELDIDVFASHYNDILLYCTKEFEPVLKKHAEAHPSWVTIEPQPQIKEVVEAPSKKEEASGDADDKKKEPKKKKPKIHGRFLESAPNHLKFLQGVEDLKSCTDASEAIKLIKRFGFVREHVPSGLLNSKELWRCMLENMPMTAMIRNLAKMTCVGLLTEENKAETESICKRLRDPNVLKAARIHPFAVLLAAAVYKSGKGDKGKLTWNPNPLVCAALDDAFYAAFANVRPTNKRFLLALDVSGSMCAQIMNSALSCRDATAALAMVTMRTEPVCEVVGFCGDLTVLDLKKTDTLSETIEKISDLPFGGTDCSLPMLWAAKQQKQFDCIIVFTDNETYFGEMHPSQAMDLYRQMSGVSDAKLIVVGMTATNFTIADPKDANMMDIVGFDSSAPELIHNFVASGFESDLSADVHPPTEDMWALALEDNN